MMPERKILAFCAAMALAVSPAGARELLFGSLAPETNVYSKPMMYWIDAVNQATDKKFPYQYVTGGALLTGKNSLDGIRDGIADGGPIPTIYYPAQMPLNNMLTNLMMTNSDNRVTAAAVYETVMLHCPSCLDEFKGNNVVPLGGGATNSYVMLCRKPATNLADIKGQRIRAAGAWARLVDYIGGTPVNTVAGEVYEGLQRGTIDCTVFPLANAVDFQLKEVSPYVTKVNMGPGYFAAFTLNKGVWDGISKEDRAIFIEKAPAAMATGVYDYINIDREYEEQADQLGLKFADPAGDLSEVLRKFGETDFESVVASVEGNGVANAREVSDIYRKMIDKWSGILAQIGDDKDAYAQALKKEIYDKLSVDF